MFDATFVVLGILTGSAFVEGTRIEILLGTLAAACIAMSVSTGVSVWEAETIEGEIRLRQLERAMLVQLRDTHHEKELRFVRRTISVVNAAAPLFVLMVTSLPLLLFRIGVIGDLELAAWISIVSAIGIVFGAGLYLGRITHTGAIKKGVRMVLVAVVTFLALSFLEIYI
ncbi:MAG: hypothetical protein ACT4OI_10695 [Methanobacteriota archaeon]